MTCCSACHLVRRFGWLKASLFVPDSSENIADPDTGKADNVSLVGTTQARIRFEPVTLHAKSTGNPAVPKQNASSYLAPKKTASGAAGRGGRGRGKGRGRGRSNGSTAPREGSAMSQTPAGHSADYGAGEGDSTMDGVDAQGLHDASPNVEEF